jgi:hypothetical protein
MGLSRENSMLGPSYPFHCNRKKQLTFPDSDLAGTANTTIKVKFNIKPGLRGAFLVMYSPRTMDMPKNILLHKLAKLESLKKKFLVTSLLSCPAYSMCLTDRGEHPSPRGHDEWFS